MLTAETTVGKQEGIACEIIICFFVFISHLYMFVFQILLGLCFITIPFIKFTKNKELSVIVIKKHDDPDADPNRAPNSVNYCDVSLFGGGQTISFPSAVYNFVTAPQIKFCYFTVCQY